MAFELVVVNNTPLVAETDSRAVARTFLTQIGYLAPKPWHVEELESVLSTSRPTVYRHLNKLKGIDLLEEVSVEDPITGQGRKAYRIRYANLTKAWQFVEAHLKVAIENYGRTVEHLSKLVMDEIKLGSLITKTA
jgi:predicted transcriptional regulator